MGGASLTKQRCELLDRILNHGPCRLTDRSGRVLNVVTQLNQPILEALDGVQIHEHVAVTPRYEWNAIPNEHRDHTDDELVNRVFVKKGGDELTAAHQPDVLAGLLPKTAHEWADGTVHELHT